MSQMRWWVVLLVLTACSSKEAGDKPANVLAKGTVSATSGVMIFHDEDPNVVLSIPPSAVMQDVEVTISTPDVDLDVDALSPVIAIAPEATPLSFPGSISIAVAAPTPNSVIARVTENGLERLPGSSVDATTHEVQAPVQRFGRFVVVDSASAKLAEPDGPASASGSVAAQGGGASAGATVANASELSGTWQGIGEHQGFTLSLADSKFTVSNEGRVVREGSFNVSGNTLSLVDAAGKTELAAVTLANDEMTLDSAQSGVVRWQRVGVPVAVEATPSGFFSTAPESGPIGVDAQAANPVAAAPKAKAPRNSTASLASATSSGKPTAPAGTATEPKKKNFFQRIGSGLKSAATGVVHGVQNLGRSTPQETTQAADAGAGTSSNNAATSPNNPPEGWTPIGDGGVGKQSTVPISGGVPQRIGPQGRPPPKGAG